MPSSQNGNVLLHMRETSTFGGMGSSPQSTENCHTLLLKLCIGIVGGHPVKIRLKDKIAHRTDGTSSQLKLISRGEGGNRMVAYSIYKEPGIM